MAYTAQAKNKIKAYFNKIDKEENLKKGEELLLKELRRKKIATAEFYKDENIEEILEEFHVGDLTELYIGIGSGKFSAISVINVMLIEEKSKEEIILSKVNNNIEIKTSAKNDIIVEGIDDIKVNVASCCKPIPGDAIVGYITKGNGISVHRCTCPNMTEVSERLIDVHWNNTITKKYSTNLLITALDNKNVLIDIISKTSSSDIIIQSINTVNSSDNTMFDIVVLTPNLEKLNKFINDLEMLEKIVRVERIIK
jgi:GTP pyrophosphokinase